MGIFFKDKKPRLDIPKEPPITEKDHRTITITREDGSTYQDDLAEFLEMVNTFIDCGYSEPNLYFFAARLFLFGEQEIAVDENRGAYYLVGAARSGHARAQYVLGSLYLKRDSCFGKHIPTAQYWLKAAAQKNYQPAIDLLNQI